MSTAPTSFGVHEHTAHAWQPRLLADIGGTNARFAVEHAPRQFDAIVTLPCNRFESFALAVQAYLQQCPYTSIQQVGVAIANPIAGDEVVMTNHHWRFSIEKMRQDMGWQTLLVTNDFTALAMSLPYLRANELEKIGGGMALPNEMIGLFGPGTGLGVSGLLRVHERWVALGSEGGHVSFSPGTPLEADILKFAWRQFTHVSFERLASGPGIELIYQALCAIRGERTENLTTAQIVERAQQRTCPTCEQTTQVLSGLLGGFAGNLAVTLGARGGIYIGGGVIGKMGQSFDRALFRQRFEDKGRFEAYVCRIPTFLIRSAFPAFVGISSILSEHLADESRHNGLISTVQQRYPDLSSAEKRVADLVKQEPDFVVNSAISEIAERAKVSQPTVIRFCRSVGTDGLAQFKLKLAASDRSIPVIHSQVYAEDATENIGNKVMDNTIAALIHTRKNLKPEHLERAIQLLMHATRIEIFAMGQSAAIAEDAENKLVRFGTPTAARVDADLQSRIVETLIPGNVILALSRTGQHGAMNTAIDLAIERGISVIAIAPEASTLASKATVAIAANMGVEVELQILPMLSRIQLLAIIDILVIGLSQCKPHQKKRLSAHTMPSNPREQALMIFGEDE